MSITAQVDTSSIDVSIDMHELRNEIAEVIGDEVPDLIKAEILKTFNAGTISIKDKMTCAEANIDNIIEAHGELLDQVVILKDKVSQLEKRNDELTARIVGAGCMLTGTRV
jgi:ubiquinone biosynthesis protein UbiJ